MKQVVLYVEYSDGSLHNGIRSCIVIYSVNRCALEVNLPYLVYDIVLLLWVVGDGNTDNEMQLTAGKYLIGER